MSTKVVHVNRVGDVNFSRNRRSKNIKITVKHNNSVLVTFPFYVSIQKALDFVSQNEAWIILQKEKFETRKRKFSEGMVVQTKLHNIEFKRGNETRIIRKGYHVTMETTEFESNDFSAFAEHLLTEIYRHEAKMLLPDRLEDIARRYGFSYNRVTIRNNRRNWGSCSSKNNISLNLQMMKMPYELIDYILLHELVHTKIRNHGPAFWKEMNLYTSNRAKELALQVKKYSAYTL